MVIEKNAGRANAIDCLLEICEMPIEPNRSVEGLPTEWHDKIIGKRVVVLYIGMETIRYYKYKLQDIYYALGYVLHVFENTGDNALVWLDDGLIELALRDIQDISIREEAKKAEDTLLKDFTVACNSIYANGDYIYRALDIADVYYGDDSQYMEFAKNRKIKTVLYDYSGQACREFLHLETWLEYVKKAFDYKVIKRGNESKQRCILFYIRPQILLEDKKLALDKLERLIAISKARKSLFFCWAEHPKTKEMIQLLPRTDKERYSMVRKAFMRTGSIVEIGSEKFQEEIKKVDIYYGDDSQALYAYDSQGIPVIKQVCFSHYRQHISSYLQKNSMGVEMGQGCWLGDFYYFSLKTGNGLCRMSWGNNLVEYVSAIPCQTSINRRTDLFSCVITYQDLLYLIPCGSRNFAIYDTRDGNWRNLLLDQNFVVDEKNDYMFSSAIRIGEVLWCIPNSYGAIVKVDLSTEMMSYFHDWHDKIKNFISKPLSTHWTGKAILVDEKIYFTASQSTHVICFDTKKETSRIFRLEVNAQGLGNIEYDGEDFWIITIREGKDKLVRWHPDKGVTLIMDDVLGKDSNGGMIIVHSKYVWIFENQKDNYARYDLENDKLTLKEHYLPEKIRGGLGGSDLYADDSYIYIFPNWGELLVKINPRTEKINAISPRLDKLGQKKYVQANFSRRYISESEFINDNELAVYFENVDLKRENMTSIGERIYNEVIK